MLLKHAQNIVSKKDKRTYESLAEYVGMMQAEYDGKEIQMDGPPL